MNREEATNVVTYLNRAGLVLAMEGQAAVWHDALADVQYQDAVEACRNLARNSGKGGRGGAFVTPGEVFGEVRRIRAARIGSRTVPDPPPALADNAAGQLRFHREYLRALGDGAPDDTADAVACRALGVTRPPAVGTSDPGRVREILASVEQGTRSETIEEGGKP